jgi:UDP-N-acetylmuramoyl-L-alanyl-D-glutamate--2,6-diaminopimelate ligase
MARWFVHRSPQQGIPSVSLRRLLPEARFLGCRDLVVSGCSADSRRLDPGQVFVALRGPHDERHDLIGRALERGAVGVLAERPCPEGGPLQVIVPDARSAHARLCQALAGEPAEQMSIIGVAGCLGRSAAATFLRSIFEAAGARFGFVGQLDWSDGRQTYPAGAVAIGASEIAEMLAAMFERGCAGGILEVTADLLDQRALEGIAFDAAVVTDLGRPARATAERLELRGRHARLFRMIKSGGSAIVNTLDPDAELLGAVNLDVRRVAFALDGTADVTGVVERQDAAGTRLRLHGFEREAIVQLRVAGPHLASSALAAAAVAWSRGIQPEHVVAGLEAITQVPGHLERIREGQAFGVWIDGSQNGPDLADTLGFLRSTSIGRIHCIVSADADPRERRGLAECAERCADSVVVSIDDPRCADPNAILDEVLASFRRPGRVRVEPDRLRAIGTTLALAVPGDAVLISGGNPRRIAMLQNRPVPRDDRTVATAWIREAEALSRRRSA